MMNKDRQFNNNYNNYNNNYKNNFQRFNKPNNNTNQRYNSNKPFEISNNCVQRGFPVSFTQWYGIFSPWTVLVIVRPSFE